MIILFILLAIIGIFFFLMVATIAIHIASDNNMQIRHEKYWEGE